MTTSKSPRRVLRGAYEAACRALPAHAHKFSPKKFTQPQLLACLVLKEFSRLDYRGLAQHLADHPDLRRLIGLKAVPHYTTFQKAARRLLADAPGRLMFDAVLRRARRDGTRRRRAGSGDADPARTYAHFPKAVFVVDRRSHLILAAVPGRGLGSGLVQFRRALEQAVRRARIGTLPADADFDAEWLHRAVRALGIRTIIPFDARPPVAGAAGGAMAPGDEATIRSAEAQVRPAMAGGGRELDDQAAAGLRASRAGRGGPAPRDHPAGHNA